LRKAVEPLWEEYSISMPLLALYEHRHLSIR
jgi:hypothetical protein